MTQRAKQREIDEHTCAQVARTHARSLSSSLPPSLPPSLSLSPSLSLFLSPSLPPSISFSLSLTEEVACGRRGSRRPAGLSAGDSDRFHNPHRFDNTSRFNNTSRCNDNSRCNNTPRFNNTSAGVLSAGCVPVVPPPPPRSRTPGHAPGRGAESGAAGRSVGI